MEAKGFLCLEYSILNEYIISNPTKQEREVADNIISIVLFPNGGHILKKTGHSIITLAQIKLILEDAKNKYLKVKY